MTVEETQNNIQFRLLNEIAELNKTMKQMLFCFQTKEKGGKHDKTK